MSESVSSRIITDLKHKVMKAVKTSKDNDYIVNPERNYTRNSKIGLLKTVFILMSFNGNGLKYELNSFFKDEDLSLSPGGLVRSRAKIKHELFIDIFNRFNTNHKCDKKYKGYHLISIDGSDINIPYDNKDLSTLHGSRHKDDGSPGIFYNQFHLNGMYDSLNNRFIDCIIQGTRECDEIKAMITMCERYKGEPSIFIADRGYEAINLFEHLDKLENHKYLIRVKDIDNKVSMFKNIRFETDEFDKDISFTLTNLNRKPYNKNPKYKIIQKYQTFDYLDDDNHFYDTKWRLVRFKIEDSYELIITNLDRGTFNSEDIKYIYNKRWKIETAYRYLKQDLKLEKFLSRKREFIKQEIWIKLILYNLSIIITNKLEERRINKKKRKHEYKINLSLAIKTIIDNLLKAIRKGGIPPDLDEMIISELSPIRNDRRFARIKRKPR